MKCGQAVEVVDWNGGVSARAVAQCGGNFLVVVHDPAWNTHTAPFRNGETLCGWQALLDRLIWLIAHPGSKEQPAFSYTVRSAGARYVQLLLLSEPWNPVRASEIAALLDAPADEVAARLHDYIVVPQVKEASDGDGG